MSKKFTTQLNAAVKAVQTNNVAVEIQFDGVKVNIVPTSKVTVVRPGQDAADALLQFGKLFQDAKGFAAGGTVSGRHTSKERMHSLYGDKKSIYLIGDIEIQGIKIEGADVIIQEDPRQWPHTELQAPIWQAAGQRACYLPDMELRHIVNCIKWLSQRQPILDQEADYAFEGRAHFSGKYFRARSDYYSVWLQRFKTELYRRHVRGLI